MKYLLLLGISNSGKSRMLTDIASHLFPTFTPPPNTTSGVVTDFCYAGISPELNNQMVYVGSAGDGIAEIEGHILNAHAQGTNFEFTPTRAADLAIFPISVESDAFSSYWFRFWKRFSYPCLSGIPQPKKDEVFVVTMPYVVEFNSQPAKLGSFYSRTLEYIKHILPLI